MLAADRQARSVAEGVSLREPAHFTSSAAPPPLQRADSIAHAVGAGIIAVGSRLDKNNYDEEMKEWARNPRKLLPKAVLLQANVAAVQAIGPLYLQQHLEQQQIDELRKAVKALKKGDVADLTKVEYQLAEAMKGKDKVDAKLADAVAHVNAVKLASAEAISPALRATPKSTPRRSPSSWPTSRVCWTW